MQSFSSLIGLAVQVFVIFDDSTWNWSSPSLVLACFRLLTSKASDFGEIHSLAFFCFFVSRGCAQFLNFLQPVQLCLFWTWKRMLIHFSRNNSTSPSHVAHVVHAHQRWFPIDLIHFLIILQDAFLAAVRNFFYILYKMPYIELMVNIRIFFTQMFSNSSVSISGDLRGYYSITFNRWQYLFKSNFLHPLQISSLSDMSQQKC